MSTIALDRAAEDAAPPADKFWSDIALELCPIAHFRLAPRHLQLLKLLADGHSGKSAAREMNLSPRTGEIYQAQIKERMGAKTLYHALAIGFRTGILS